MKWKWKWQWQCAEKTHPYLFSQCQAIHARSLVPCQDMPAVKMSYSATVWVPQELTALMSAVPVDDGQVCVWDKIQETGIPRSGSAVIVLSVCPTVCAWPVHLGTPESKQPNPLRTLHCNAHPQLQYRQWMMTPRS